MKRLTLVALALSPTLAFASISNDLDSAMALSQDLNPTSVKIQLNIAPDINSCILDQNSDPNLPPQGTFCPVPAEAVDTVNHIQYLDTGRYLVSMKQNMADGYTITPAGNSGANYSEMSLTFNVSTVEKTPNSFVLECSNNNGYVDDCAGSVLVAGSFASNVEFVKQLELNGHLASIESTVQSIANDNALEHSQEAVITAQDNAIALVNAAKQEAADADNALELKIDGKLASQKQALRQEIHAGDWATIARVDNGDAANKTLIDANTTKLGNLETTVAGKADATALATKADKDYVDQKIADLPVNQPGVDNCNGPGYRIIRYSGVESCERDPGVPVAVIFFNGQDCPNNVCSIKSGYGISSVTLYPDRNNGAYPYRLNFTKNMPDTNYIVTGLSSWSGSASGLAVFERMQLDQYQKKMPRGLDHYDLWTSHTGQGSKHSSENIGVAIWHLDAK